ncbi:hypothetical protein [Litorihabitans aurantiacus]|uniref:Uncharacterized protein n=1 Tax=Litorihabitans aurantiacus TaxID=1930061 RepID=A0AA37XDL9_9MICO|nr:hypothetical protein [Litorihabitans aurantiacus]GMA30047.1 hypothetical protein GCM10025875_00390 [Litorihabitans aurantiacus]GMA33546.1 hypothetical protein GCM10025875_35380 [Litorihabitans aurantiacus]
MVRWRRSPVLADVGEGFLAIETTAHQPALETSAGSGRARGAAQELPARFTLHAETGGAVVIAWHNRNVGFVPASHHTSISEQIVAARGARVEADGEVFRLEGSWRVWVGPRPRPRDAGPPDDAIAPKPFTILGIPVTRNDP